MIAFSMEKIQPMPCIGPRLSLRGDISNFLLKAFASKKILNKSAYDQNSRYHLIIINLV